MTGLTVPFVILAHPLCNPGRHRNRRSRGRLSLACAMLRESDVAPSASLLST